MVFERLGAGRSRRLNGRLSSWRSSALSLVLLVGGRAGCFGASRTCGRSKLGFNPDHVVVGAVCRCLPTRAANWGAGARRLLWRRFAERLRALPGVARCRG